MKNLIKGLTIISFIALTAYQKGFDTHTGIHSGAAVGAVITENGEVAPELQEAVAETEQNVEKMEVHVDQSLKQMDALFASMQSAILANTANMSTTANSGGGFDFGGILGSIGSIILGGFNPISLIMGGINLVTGIIDGFSGGSQPAVFNDFQATFNSIFGNIQSVVTDAKGIISQQRSLIVAQLATMDASNPAHAALYQQLMGIMSQLDAADQKIISRVADVNTRAQSFMSQVAAIKQRNGSSGIGAMAGSFLQNFQGIIGTALQALFQIL